MKTIEQWTVTDAYANDAPRTFENFTSAMAFAVDNARPTHPTFVILPDGKRLVVLAHSERVHLQVVTPIT